MIFHRWLNIWQFKLKPNNNNLGREELDYVKQTNVESKTASVIQKVLDVLPQAAQTTATVTPLAPLSKLIAITPLIS